MQREKCKCMLPSLYLSLELTAHNGQHVAKYSTWISYHECINKLLSLHEYFAIVSLCENTLGYFVILSYGLYWLATKPKLIRKMFCKPYQTQRNRETLKKELCDYVSKSA